MNSKKGSILFWAPIFLVLILGFSLVVFNVVDVGVKVKGDWQRVVLEDFVYAGESKLGDLDTRALVVGRALVLDLAQKGGHFETPSCGEVFGRNIWNSQSVYCFPQPWKKLSNPFNELYQQYDKDAEDFVVSVDGKDLRGKSDSEIVVNSLNPKYGKSQYSLLANFRVDLGYDFMAYKKLGQQSITLLQKCNGEQGLESCIEFNKEKNWYFDRCDRAYFKSDGRVVPFCVVGSKILDNGGKTHNVEYLFALDFP